MSENSNGLMILMNNAYKQSARRPCTARQERRTDVTCVVSKPVHLRI